MQDAMVRAAEAVIFEQPVGVADEVPIGKEKQFHEIERLAILRRPRRARPKRAPKRRPKRRLMGRRLMGRLTGRRGGERRRRRGFLLEKLAQSAWLRP
ncbi:hypothetical protein LMG27198_23860 [Methylocystis echinoides]|uniref:Uncharacterized protein n=1 Tax=Methylocystis echinoides TaxID=29468 RepID=A0A9W6GV13_9HYPH|nr:hypothetical protein LMG27198_23860 [Methylocystis echinoides]